MSRRFVTYNTEDQKAGSVPVNEKGVLQPHGGEGGGLNTIVFTRDARMKYACNVPYEEFETAVMKGLPMVFIDTSHNGVSTNVSVCKNSDGESWSVSAYDAYSEDDVHFTYAPTFIGEV